MDMFAGEDWRASKDRAPVASLNKRDHYSRKTLAVQQQMRWQDMTQDHNVRNRNHYVDFNRLLLHRSIAPIDLTPGDLSRLSRFSRTFIWQAAPALYDPAGLAPALGSLS